MNVLIITTQYPNSINSNNSTFLLEQVTELKRLGCNIHVISPIAITLEKNLVIPNAGIISNWRSWVKRKYGIPLHSTNNGIPAFHPKFIFINFLRLTESIFYYLAVRRILSKYLSDIKFDLLHSHFLVPDGVVATKIANQLQVPSIVSCMGSDVRIYAQRKSLKQISHNTIWEANAIIVKSPSLAKLLPFRKSTLHHVHNGVNISKFQNNKNIRDDEILFVGNLIIAKGVFELLRAFTKVREKIPSIRLTLIGSGKEKANIERFIKKSNMQESVRLLGTVNQDDLVGYYQRSRLTCLPSYQEGTPNVVMESISCGTPVVGSNIDGIADIIVDTVGVLCNPKSTMDLYNKLMYSLNKIWDYQLIRNYAEQKLDHKKQAKKIFKIYQKSLSDL
jgi:teichuronic acid biosynthesis glycosyltransferase TuaC